MSRLTVYMKGDLIKVEAWFENENTGLETVVINVITTEGYYERYLDISSLDHGIHEWDFYGGDE